VPAANFGPYHVRKWFTFVEDTQANESGQAAEARHETAAAAQDITGADGLR
jgi:hypothetical protein